MGEADNELIRAVLREHGEDPPARGRLSAEWRAKYQAIVDGGPPPADDDVTGITDITDVADVPDVPEEQRPRRPKVRAPRLPRPAGGGKKRGRVSRAAHKRVPVDRLVERGWEMLARLASPIDAPVGRCLSMQAPVAGLIMEDIVRDTVVDRVLQPVARAEDRAEKIIALAAPPLIVAALEQAQALPDDQRALREAILVPLLRESMVAWIRIAGDKVEERARRDAEIAPAMAKVDELLSMIFAPPPGEEPGEPADQEHDRGQHAMAGAVILGQ